MFLYALQYDMRDLHFGLVHVCLLELLISASVELSRRAAALPQLHPWSEFRIDKL